MHLLFFFLLLLRRKFAITIWNKNPELQVRAVHGDWWDWALT